MISSRLEPPRPREASRPWLPRLWAIRARIASIISSRLGLVLEEPPRSELPRLREASRLWLSPEFLAASALRRAASASTRRFVASARRFASSARFLASSLPRSAPAARLRRSSSILAASSRLILPLLTPASIRLRRASTSEPRSPDRC